MPTDIAAITSAADRTVGSGSTLNTQVGRTQNLYDHVLVHDEIATSELLGDAVVLDMRSEADSTKAFHSTVSRHLPIVVKLKSGGPGRRLTTNSYSELRDHDSPARGGERRGPQSELCTQTRGRVWVPISSSTVS